MKFQTALIAFFFALPVAFASNEEASCTNVDLRPLMGPMRDQGDKGWCYANAASDLLSFKHRKELEGQQVSAAYTALTYLRNVSIGSNSEGDGGFVSGAVIAAEEFGFCPRIMEEKVEGTGLSKLTLRERLETLQNFKKDFDLWHQNHDQAAKKRFVARYRQYKLTKSYVAQMPSATLISILISSDEDSFINEFAKKICKDQIEYPVEKSQVVFSTKLMSPPFDVNLPKWLTGLPRATTVHVGPIAWNPFTVNVDYVSKVDEQLSKNNIVAIDYFADFLGTDYLKNPYTPRDGMHASVLVGRRWNKETRGCEYLIRNSWGARCSAYDANIVKNKYCEAGNIWVPEHVLRYNMYAYIYLK